jgi:nucleoside-diphosphate-sugar epimerase
MRILITGINGFIGRNLAAKLNERGHDVVGVGRQFAPKVDNVGYWMADINDPLAMSTIDYKPDVIVHLAGPTAHETLVETPHEAIRAHSQGLINVLNLFDRSKARRFIFASSGKVYGNRPTLPSYEEDDTEPDTIVGRMKILGEHIVRDWCLDREFYSSRIFNVWGPRQSEQFFVPTVLKQLKEGCQILCLGNVDDERDFIHVDDVVSALVLLAESQVYQNCGAVNVCTGVSRSPREIVKIISNLMGEHLSIEVDLEKTRDNETSKEQGDPERLKKFGWSVSRSFEDQMQSLLVSEGF